MFSRTITNAIKAGENILNTVDSVNICYLFGELPVTFANEPLYFAYELCRYSLLMMRVKAAF